MLIPGVGASVSRSSGRCTLHVVLNAIQSVLSVYVSVNNASWALKIVLSATLRSSYHILIYNIGAALRLNCTLQSHRNGCHTRTTMPISKQCVKCDTKQLFNT